MVILVAAHHSPTLKGTEKSLQYALKLARGYYHEHLPKCPHYPKGRQTTSCYGRFTSKTGADRRKGRL